MAGLANILFPAHYDNFADHGLDCKDLDVKFVNNSIKNNTYLARIYKLKDNIVLRLYSPAKIVTLSKVIPILSSLGFEILTEENFSINDGTLFLHRYLLKLSLATDLDITSPNIAEILCNIIVKSINGEIKNDPINKLCYLGEIDVRYTKLIAAYIAYLKQIKFTIDSAKILNIFEANYDCTIGLLDLFQAKFSKNKAISAAEIKKQEEKIYKILEKKQNTNVDKVILMFIKLINATVRTNFYLNKDYISIKIKSSQLDLGLKPVAFAEIFVFSDDFEAIHIRNGSVSRGGLRWSDRGDDYYTEVFGLAKTQLAKNSIIVPSGSKGGFYIKKSSADKAFAVECYKNFLRGMLDITDNVVNEKIIQPKIAIYDDEDPYLVVAADKGTATFSDYANAISAEYNFWLKDAFASGGSNGYDHKKLAITARGAWESVKRHLMELGLNIEKDVITAVGIGGMMGDVFGNGLIYSSNIKLIAAFNQDHIFVDPDPDCKKSYKERCRMFKALDGWDGYNKEIISKGGAIFNRNDTNIKLSKEIMEILNIENDKKIVTGDELVKYILKAEVDLLFNGGIGTFVKSETESNADANDKNNDNIRINGNEVGASIIAEGGNLGMTQLGRIEYCLSGGKCNTDAIDNSAGVSCSDHEVNIKIALNQAITDKQITIEERNEILADMENDVCNMVLQDNILQTRAISLCETFDKGKKILKYVNLIKTLEEKDLIKRKNESLPTVQEIMNRSIAGTGLTRPEISILLSYSKIYIKHLIESEIKVSNNEYFASYLRNYFPSTLSAKFDKYVKNHKLKENIIANCLVNDFINLLLPSAFVDIKNISNASTEDILVAYIIVKQIFDVDNLVQEISSTKNNIPVHAQYSSLYLISEVVKKGICNLLTSIDIDIKNVKKMSEFIKIANKLHHESSGSKKDTHQVYHNQTEEVYINEHLPSQLHKKLVLINKFRGIIPVSSIVIQAKCSVENAYDIYNQVDYCLNLQYIKELLSTAKINNYWDSVAISQNLQFITRVHIELTKYLLSNKKDINHLKAKCNKILEDYNLLISQLKNQDTSVIAVSILSVEKLRRIKDNLLS